MRLDKPRLLDPDSVITREIAEAFPEAVAAPGQQFRECCDTNSTCFDHNYICTRPPGHDGPHVAHVATDQPVAVWPREDGK